MNNQAIKAIRIEGLHGRFKIAATLHNGLNIIFGKNGTGKTTFLHIVANLVEGDIERFCHIRFDNICVDTYSNSCVVLRQIATGGDTKAVEVIVDGSSVGTVSSGEDTSPSLRELIRQHLGGRPVYLPAFRSVLEALSRNKYRYPDPDTRSDEYKRTVDRLMQEVRREHIRNHLVSAPPIRVSEKVNAIAYKTVLCREWFGAFVPIIRCPSLGEVAEELSDELRDALVQIGSTDRKAFQDVFYEVLQAILTPSDNHVSVSADTLLEHIRESMVKLEQGASEVPEQIAELMHQRSQPLRGDEAFLVDILKVYDHAIHVRNKAQEEAFMQLSTFEKSVNKFLDGKQLAIARQSARFSRPTVVKLDDGTDVPLSVLSSGERHVLTLLFSATHMSVADGIVLVDEPELSLHVDWQRIILGELIKQAGDRQIIACTHAPEIGADHFDAMTDLVSSSQAARLIDLQADPDDILAEALLQ